MAEYEVLVIDTSVPEIRAPASGDTYTFPRDANFAAGATKANVDLATVDDVIALSIALG